MKTKPAITDHARGRAKERLGLNLHALERLVVAALEKGLRPADTRGALRRYLDGEALKDNARPVVYGCHVFIFGAAWALVTVFELPHEFRRSAENARAKKQKGAAG